jgi:hypothetical protein
VFEKGPYVEPRGHSPLMPAIVLSAKSTCDSIPCSRLSPAVKNVNGKSSSTSSVGRVARRARGTALRRRAVDGGRTPPGVRAGRDVR